MGFNRRKLEEQRQEAAAKEAASRRATDAQVLEDAERLIAAWNEAKRMPMLFSPTIGAAIKSGLLVRMGEVSGLPDDERNRLAHTRPTPRCGSKQPHPSVVVPIMPAECTVCRVGTSLADKHRRRNTGRTSSSRFRRMIHVAFMSHGAAERF